MNEQPRWIKTNWTDSDSWPLLCSIGVELLFFYFKLLFLDSSRTQKPLAHHKQTFRPVHSHFVLDTRKWRALLYLRWIECFDSVLSIVTTISWVIKDRLEEHTWIMGVGGWQGHYFVLLLITLGIITRMLKGRGRVFIVIYWNFHE